MLLRENPSYFRPLRNVTTLLYNSSAAFGGLFWTGLRLHHAAGLGRPETKDVEVRTVLQCTDVVFIYTFRVFT